MMDILRKPSAWIPIALSLFWIVWWVYFFVMFGTPRPDPQADEGVAAHLFQLWLVIEVFMIGFFMVRWLPKKPISTLLITTLQIFLVIAASAPVFYFQL